MPGTCKHGGRKGHCQECRNDANHEFYARRSREMLDLEDDETIEDWQRKRDRRDDELVSGGQQIGLDRWTEGSE